MEVRPVQRKAGLGRIAEALDWLAAAFAMKVAAEAFAEAFAATFCAMFPVGIALGGTPAAGL